MASTILKPSNVLCILLLIVVLYSPISCKADNILYSGDTLNTEDILQEGRFWLVMQTDCNLVLYDITTPVWASNTGGLGRNCSCTLKTDGSLVVRRPSGDVIWKSTGTQKEGNYVLVLQKDRNAVIYGPKVWATGTNRVSHAPIADVVNNIKGRNAKFMSPKLESVVGAVIN